MKKLFIFYSIFFVVFALASNSADLSNANYLADQGIIIKQISPSDYRWQESILRQEVIGMALKIQWITLPENYTCKKYFSDATKNDWVCRALEIAADNGIISRSNKQARPLDKITRSEALAILLKTGKISTTPPRKITQPDRSVWSLFQDLQKQGFTQWQADMLDSLPNCFIINHGISCEDGTSTNKVFAQFWPNEIALRASVFEYAALMMWFRAEDDFSFALDDFSVLIDTPSELIPDGHFLSAEALKSLLLGEPIDTLSKTPEVAMVVFSDLECPFCGSFFSDAVLPIIQNTSLNTFLVYKHFPLIFLHKNSYNWAIEAKCIEKNIGNEDFFHYIYDRQAAQSVSVSVLAPKLTTEQMNECKKDRNILQDISDDQNLWTNTYNISGTPTTLIINMKTHYYETISGAQTRELVEAVIQSVKDH